MKGLCACGCGQPTRRALVTVRSRGWTKGAPRRFLRGHNHPTNFRHGQARKGRQTSEYTIWAAMLHRCRNPKDRHWARYGGRGISVCERWLHFEEFFADMGPRPSHDHSLDRIDSDGPYAPGNVRWTTRAVQNRNTSRNHFITRGGITLCVADWARRLGLSYSGLQSRLRRLPPDEALRDIRKRQAAGAGA